MSEASAASIATEQAPETESRLVQWTRRVEDGALLIAFAFVTLLPLVLAIGRWMGGLHLPDGHAYLQQAVLWLTFLGGLLATREEKHIVLSSSELLASGQTKRWLRLGAFAVAAAVAVALAWSSFQVVRVDKMGGHTLAGGLPVWVSELIMPIALTLIALRFALHAGDKWWQRGVAVLLIPVAFALALLPDPFYFRWPLVLLVLVAAVSGAPMFIAMAGVAMVLFFTDGISIAAVSADVYRLLGSPTLPAIPLLTGAGYLLAESKAADRLVRLFRAVFGWIPGGVAVLVAALCAVFTTMTGGSGVTILALGGLVLGILRKDEYPDGFSVGLVTASGSLGLLFFPAVPVILYAVVAQIPADQLFVAGALPGLLLCLLVAGYGVYKGYVVDAKRTQFDAREVGRAAWAAKWEISVPVLIAFLVFGGFTSMVEAAAAAMAYSLFIVAGVHRDLHITKEVPKVVVQAGVLVGAVLVLLSSALGFTSYLVDAMIPTALVDFATGATESKLVFLLGLNIVLLVLGSVLEIYAAIIVLAPLVAPLGEAFGVHPVHLGIIFIANLELGFLFPPVGLNLLLSSLRFERPLPSLYKHVLPFLAILAVGVLLITYFEPLSVGVLELYENYRNPPAVQSPGSDLPSGL